MSKTATKPKAKESPKASEPEAPEIRSLGVGAWPERGQTGDSGAGSRARAALGDLDDAGQRTAKGVYDKVVGIVGKLTEGQQRAIGFALASDYSWDCLIAKSKHTARAVWKNADQETWDRLAKMQDAEGLTMAEIMGRFSSVKDAVKAERAARRKKSA